MALSDELEKQGSWLFKYRGQLPLVLIIAGLTIYIFKSFGLKNSSYDEALEITALITSLSGLFVRIYAIGYASRGSSGRNTKEQVADQLNTRGIYSIVRHPLYVGNFLMWLGICLFVGNPWFVIIFILVYWIYYERIMFTEENFLKGKFGEDYLNWAKKTPAFIPKFSLWKSPGVPFDYKEVLKREYNGLFSLIAVFVLFDYVGDYIRLGGIFKDNDDKIWIAILGFTFFLLVTLKFLKKKTHILDKK
jgi:protein-S-isoprenylcysteine O-methyltransferase Ste14